MTYVLNVTATCPNFYEEEKGFVYKRIAVSDTSTEKLSQHPIHRDLWDGVVRVGSLSLNHPELVPKHPTHIALSVVVCFL